VDVGFGHRLQIDNVTVSQLGMDTFGEFDKHHHLESQQHITPDIISVPSVVVPDYGTTPPYSPLPCITPDIRIAADTMNNAVSSFVCIICR
jgi:hypothetical protein